MSIVPHHFTATTVAPQTQPTFTCAAARLTPPQRQQLALDVLSGHYTISDLANRHGVSRKFVRSLRRIALDALDTAFAPSSAAHTDVLFLLPVTRVWLEQLALALLLVCHSSLRGVHELFRDLFDTRKSIGSIHNLVKGAIAKAIAVNSSEDLSGVLVAALDEIFQNRQPILSVVDVASTYCCLLSPEEHRDGDTWAIRLLDLQKQGFNPHTAIGDGGQGLRSGAAEALPDVPCRADIFHAERDLGALIRFLQNRAYAAIKAYDKLQGKLHAKQQRGSDDQDLQHKRDAAYGEMVAAMKLADDVALLGDWLRYDVLGVAGPNLLQRQELFDFIVAELKTREPLCTHRIKPVCTGLGKHKAELLAFVEELDMDISSLAAWARVPEEVVREMVAVQEMPACSVRKWQRDARLHERLGQRYHELSEMVEALRQGVVRASSVVENLHSRVRNYLFLRKEAGSGYLELLRFFLNHRRFLRSEHAERIDKSPAELLSGQEHDHWLEMLGYTLFRKSA
jgi:hypothetical protein